MRSRRRGLSMGAFGLVALALLAGGEATAKPPQSQTCEFNDSHFHLTNYVQEGLTAADFLKLVGDRVCRSTLFGIPLQQEWSYRETGDFAPTYYLEADAPLYYYSFTDAVIAMEYRALPPAERDRLDPMITGFNPADMYAADHVRRVLTLFPGVFSGIGEFSVHKEFVSPKIAGGAASLTDPALDRLLDFAGQVGLVVILHNDMVRPFTKDAKVRPYFEQLTALYARHPGTTIIWAHVGLGRVVQPVKGQAAYLEEILSNPAMRNIYFDLSWDELAKYIVASDESLTITARLINKYPDRFLFGTDVVAPRKPEQYFGVYEMYAPLWARLTPDAREKVLKGNYVRLFDEGRRRVRAWERANVPVAATGATGHLLGRAAARRVKGTVLMQWFDATPLWLIGAALLLIFLSSEALGFRFRRFVSSRRGSGRPGEERLADEGVGNLVGAALGLLALIFGFTYAMAQERYDQRRMLVMSEARAVTTSYLRFQAFDEPERSQLSHLMGQYTVLRARQIDAQRDRASLGALVARTEQFQSQIWGLVLPGLRRRPELVEPIMESTNQMFEISATRRAIVDARIPLPIEIGLVVFGMMTAFFTGYCLALDRRHRMALVGLFLLFASVYILVLDLERSYSGPIRVSQAPMIQAADRIARLEAAKDRR